MLNNCSIPVPSRSVSVVVFKDFPLKQKDVLYQNFTTKNKKTLVPESVMISELLNFKYLESESSNSYSGHDIIIGTIRKSI